MIKNITDDGVFDEHPAVELIMGDLFEGIAVSDYSDKIYECNHEGKHIKVVQKTVKLMPDRICVGFLFLLEEPHRFRVDVLVPENCTNARVSLQDQELIGFFSPNIPDALEPVKTSACGHQTKISTLRPGEFQSINFLWKSGDVLKFFFYFGNYENN